MLEESLVSYDHIADSRKAVLLHVITMSSTKAQVLRQKAKAFRMWQDLIHD